MKLSGPIVGLVLALLLLAGVAPPPAQADWLSKLIVAGERVSGKAVARSGSALEPALAKLGTLAPSTRASSLGATVSQEGHWTFVNAGGERLTAAGAAELARVLPMVAPAAATPGSRLTFYLTEDTVFRAPTALKELPAGSDLFVMVGRDAYKLVRRGDGSALHAEIRPNVLLAVSDRRMFDEAAFQLARPLRKADIRILSLEPSGPGVLPSSPNIDPTAKRALVDMVDPANLAGAFASIRGQTVVVTGRVDAGRLTFVPASGGERSLDIATLVAAAEAADVNLVVLKSSSARQPGGRNWLWQRVEVDNIDKALERATVSDFLNALGGQERQLIVSAKEQGAGRIAMTAVPVSTGGSLLGVRVDGLFSDLVSEIAGRVVTTGIEANVRSSERQRELDVRLIPGLPSAVQFAYVGLAVLGLLGFPVARRWWDRIWPPERRDEYSGPLGYWSARIVKGAAFVLIFLPLAGGPAAIWNTGLQLWALIGWPLRAWRWFTGRRAGAT